MRYKKKGKPQGKENAQSEVAFAQSKKASFGEKDLKDVTCYHCGENNHYASECDR